jgi:hypothetical protein
MNTTAKNDEAAAAVPTMTVGPESSCSSQKVKKSETCLVLGGTAHSVY